MQYILFDLDGTLTDSKLGITNSAAYALEKFHIKVENLDDLTKFIGPPLMDSFMEYYNMSEEDALTAVTYYREYFAVKGVYENSLYDGIKDLLIELKQRNMTLIVATSKPTFYATKILEHFGIMEYFTFVAGSELDGTRARKAEVISYVLEENSIEDLSKAIMIGDRKHDVIGAKEMGVESIGVLYGFGDKEELEQAGADHIVATVTELEEFLLA